MLLTSYVSFIIYVINILCFLHYFNHSDRNNFNTIQAISSQRSVCSDSVRSVGYEHSNYVLLHPMCLSVCLSVIQYEENNFWIGFL